MIPALGAGGPGFKSRRGPFLLLLISYVSFLVGESRRSTESSEVILINFQSTIRLISYKFVQAMKGKTIKWYSDGLKNSYEPQHFNKK